MERLRDFRPHLLENQKKWHHRAFGGTTRLYFARAPHELFPVGSSQVAQSGMFSKLSGGWYANVNLSHGQKFDILLRLGAICQLTYPEDIDFRVTGASVGLAEKQAAVALANQLLEELRNL